ncbi:hypothetical protein LBBP_00545 [Leptospira borgpetersenii serovar Ballum]|uniref:Uncharacterized protein n=1 Tax=Leptospira borgpetersenii serovar Ballum TaxID=280505 RepID=A0A0S2IN38_LEPBO|nr:hypothetical protein LBBP_00545 [Leptospira borgpetersenii serovar Ballum]
MRETDVSLTGCMFYRIQVEICFESVFLLELILINDLVYKT